MRTGGAGEFFARAGSRAALLELLRWAAGEGLELSVVGSGSNLLIADEGVDGLVIKLDRELARDRAGWPERCWWAAARACRRWPRERRAAGLSGIEFGVNIPGTRGRRRADERQRLRRRAGARAGVGGDRDAPRACRAARPRELGFAYRRSSLRAGEIVLGARARARARRRGGR